MIPFFFFRRSHSDEMTDLINHHIEMMIKIDDEQLLDRMATILSELRNIRECL
jgi:hypothetical protein